MTEQANESRAKSKWQMTANPAECRLCFTCQLVCSLKQDSTFNPSKAYIIISKFVRPNGKLDVEIFFTEECDNCGLCAKYCNYGALSREKLSVAQASS